MLYPKAHFETLFFDSRTCLTLPGDYMCNLGLTSVWELNVHLMHQQT